MKKHIISYRRRRKNPKYKNLRKQLKKMIVNQNLKKKIKYKIILDYSGLKMKIKKYIPKFYINFKCIKKKYIITNKKLKIIVVFFIKNYLKQNILYNFLEYYKFIYLYLRKINKLYNLFILNLKFKNLYLFEKLIHSLYILTLCLIFKYSIFLIFFPNAIRYNYINYYQPLFKKIPVLKKKINKKKLITLKLEIIKLEIYLFKSTNKFIFLKLKNIYNSLNSNYLISIPKASRIWWASNFWNFRDFINILFFSSYFYNTELLATFISRNITNKKNHFPVLKGFKRTIKYFFWFERASQFRGFCFKVHGKFNGVLKRRRFQMKLGRNDFNTFTTRVEYNYQQSFTRFGVFSVKVWLLYNK